MANDLGGDMIWGLLAAVGILAFLVLLALLVVAFKLGSLYGILS